MRTVAEFEAAARQRLDPAHYDYFAGGAQDEITLRENESAYKRLRLLPRVLRGSDKRRNAAELGKFRPEVCAHRRERIQAALHDGARSASAGCWR